MKFLFIVLFIMTVIWGVWETWHKYGLIYFIAKKDIQPTQEEIAECLKEVIKHYLKSK